MTDQLILEVVHGSRAYGLDGPTSDLDLKGVFVADRTAWLGFRPWPEQREVSQERVHYDLRKFFVLAAACNPTLIELLFTEPGDIKTLTDAGRLLLEHRSLFLSRRARDSFGRYGLAQLKRIRTHRRWLLSPPEAPPRRVDFGLPERPVLPRDQMGAARALIERGELTVEDLGPNFLELLDRERRYRAAQQEWTQFRTWETERNPARSELERRHGYDTKHAMHLVRLLRMAHEILTTGQVHVRRPDADELKAIRGGALDYDALVESAEELGRRLEFDATVSSLPAAPDEEQLEALCVRIASSALGLVPS